MSFTSSPWSPTPRSLSRCCPQSPQFSRPSPSSRDFSSVIQRKASFSGHRLKVTGSTCRWRKKALSGACLPHPPAPNFSSGTCPSQWPWRWKRPGPDGLPTNWGPPTHPIGTGAVHLRAAQDSLAAFPAPSPGRFLRLPLLPPGVPGEEGLPVEGAEGEAVEAGKKRSEDGKARGVTTRGFVFLCPYVPFGITKKSTHRDRIICCCKGPPPKRFGRDPLEGWCAFC